MSSVCSSNASSSYAPMSTRSQASSSCKNRTPGGSDISSPLLAGTSASFNFSPPAAVTGTAFPTRANHMRCGVRAVIQAYPKLSPEPLHYSASKQTTSLTNVDNNAMAADSASSKHMSSNSLATRYQAYYRNPRRVSCPLSSITTGKESSSDIVTRLYQANCFLARTILCRVPAKWLREAAACSKTWFEMINSIPEAKSKIDDYIAAIPERAEDMHLDSFGIFRSPMRPNTRSNSLVGTSELSPSAAQHHLSVPRYPRRFLRSPIANRQSMLSVASSSTIKLSPRSSHRQSLGKSIKPDERCGTCPRCSYPTVINQSSSTGRCTKCELRYCSKCSHDFDKDVGVKHTCRPSVLDMSTFNSIDSRDDGIAPESPPKVMDEREHEIASPPKGTSKKSTTRRSKKHKLQNL